MGHWSYLKAECGPWNQDNLSLIHLMWKNLDFLKVVLRPSESDSNRAEEKGKSTH